MKLNACAAVIRLLVDFHACRETKSVREMLRVFSCNDCRQGRTKRFIAQVAEITIHFLSSLPPREYINYMMTWIYSLSLSIPSYLFLSFNVCAVLVTICR